MEINKKQIYNIALNLASHLGNDLLQVVESTGDPISFGYANNRIIISLFPVQRAAGVFSIDTKIYKISRSPFKKPRELASKSIEVKTFPVENMDLGATVFNAVTSLGNDSLMLLSSSKEPITLTAGDKQVEVSLDVEGVAVNPHVFID